MDGSSGDDLVQDGARSGASRLRILQVLRQAEEGLGVRELAAEIGLHGNTIRFHLDRLVADGVLVRQIEARSTPGRPRLTFTVVAGPGSHGDERSYPLLAEILAGFLADTVPDPAAAATEAGRRWGRHLTEGTDRPYRQLGDEEAIAELLAILNRMGFLPESAQVGGRRELWFRHCPFLEVAMEHREVVCSVHLGLMQGALAEMWAPMTVDRLEPLVEPALCVAGLAEADAPSGRT